MYLDVFLYDRNIIGSSSAICGYLRKSLAIFGQCSETTIWPSDNFERIFENLQKIVKKSSFNSMFYDKQNNSWLLVDMEFLFSCSTYLTRSLRSLMRYQVEHSKRNSVSTHYPMHYPLFISEQI